MVHRSFMPSASQKWFFTLLSIFLLASTHLWSGCSDAPSNEVTIEERDGVTYVTNTGTRVWNDHDAAPIQFTLEQSFGAENEPEEAMLATVRGIVVDADGIVYVLDEGNNRLIAFNPDGSLLWSVGRAGEGPGEFNGAFGMVSDGDSTIYISNQRSTRIDAWSTDGTFIESVNLSEMELMGTIASYVDGMLVLSGWAQGGLQRFHFVDPTRWTHERTVDIDIGLELHDRFYVNVETFPYEDGFWLGHIDTYQIGYYTPDGTLQKRIERPVFNDDLVGGVMARDERSWTIYSNVSAPRVLSDGSLIVTSSWPANVSNPVQHFEQSRSPDAPETIWASALDLFTPEGHFRGRLQWEDSGGRSSIPGLGRLHTTGPNGALYTSTTSPFPHVRRYAVTIE